MGMALSVGRLDWRNAMHELTPEQAEEWRTLFAIEGRPMDRLYEILRNGLCAVANAFGGKWQPKDIDPWHEPPKRDSEDD